MITKTYIQRGDHGEIMSDASYAFWDGCRQLGFEIAFFTKDSFDAIELTKETLVNGGIGMVRKAFDRLGVPQPKVGEAPPASLLPFYGRRVWPTTMLEVRQGYEDNKFFFIKPLKEHKVFTGHVTSGSISTLAQTARFNDDFEILASEVAYFRTEYRLFVHNRKILDARLYRGNYRDHLDFTVADAAIQTWENQPVAYSLDLGLADDGRTLIVEINDCFSLGSYGFPSLRYAQMVVDRWEEIVSAL